MTKTCLSTLQFTTFGLGDSGYANYNTVARKLHQRVLDLGGTKIHDRGLGDDQHDIGYDSAFIPWLESLSSTLEARFGIPDEMEVVSKDILVPSKYTIHYHEDNGNGLSINGSNDRRKQYLAPLIKHDRITPDDHWQDVRNLTFDITDSQLTYAPGDVLLLFPINPRDEIDKLCSVLNIENPQSTMISIEYNNSSKVNICKNLSDDLIGLVPPKLSIYDLFERHLDICGVPRRAFFERLVHFTENEAHKNKLIELCSNTSEGQIALYEYNQSESRTFIEVLHDFNSCNIPLDYLLSLIPKLKPRKYSISSAMEYYFDDENCVDNDIPIDVVSRGRRRKLVEVTVALVEYETPLKRKRKGLCSRYIASWPFTHRLGDQQVDDQKQNGNLNGNPNGNQVGNNEVIRVPLWIEKGSFRFKSDWLSSNVLMIGPGTGIAPFRSMCQYRYYLKNNGLQQQEVGDCLVFFGNRNREKDYFYESEWRKMESKGSVFKMVTAFSRDQNRKIYVTDKMRKHAELIWNWISVKKCYILVAGSSLKMPNDVRNVIIEIVGKFGKMNSKAAQKVVANLERHRRYQSETWS